MRGIQAKYRAFLSYSHADAVVARRVHGRLEGFPIDKDIVGRDTPAGPIPKTLRPIFRDRYEFSAGDLLEEQTITALDDFDALIVLASPDAARSKYVNEEVRQFKSRHSDRPVIPLIVDGEPGHPQQECFPPALRFAVAKDGAITNTSVSIVAADLREKGDGFELALAKVVARLLGLAPDDVYRRAERERRKQARLRASFAAVIAVLAIAAAGFYWQSRQKAQTLAEITALVDKYSLVTAAEADTPGTRASLTRAITNIAEGAATDPRYAKALDLLKAGKAAEAEPLLKAVADDKVKRGENDAKDAAAAYRNLASIATVTDPGRAREYYAQAARLDPSDIAGMLRNGQFQEQAGQLDAAQAAYTHVIASAAPGDDEDILWAKIGIGDIAHRRGNLPDALATYQDAASIADRLAQSDPGNDQWQRDVAFSDERLGNVQVAQGNLSAALASYQASLAIAERFAKSDPDNVKRQHDVAFLEQKLGNVQDTQGDRQSALNSFQASFTIIDRLAKSDPSNTAWQSDLAIANKDLGYVQLAQGNLPAALTSYQATLTIMDRLANTDPGNALWQRELGAAYNNVGNVQMVQINQSAALASYQAALAIAERVAKTDPTNAGWQRDLSLSYEYIGNVELKQGNLSAALTSFQDRLAIAQRLANSDPSNAQWQRELAVAHNRIGGVQAAQSDRAAALTSYQASLAIVERLAKSDPATLRWQHDVAISNSDVGNIKMAQGDREAALTAYQAAFAIMDRLAKSDPDNAQWQRDLALSYAKLADVYQKSGQQLKANEALVAGRTIIARLSAQYPDQVLWKQDLARFDRQIAALKPQ